MVGEMQFNPQHLVITTFFICIVFCISQFGPQISSNCLPSAPHSPIHLKTLSILIISVSSIQAVVLCLWDSSLGFTSSSPSSGQRSYWYQDSCIFIASHHQIQWKSLFQLLELKSYHSPLFIGSEWVMCSFLNLSPGQVVK